MKPSRVIGAGGVMLLGVLLVGCATDTMESASRSCGSNYACLRDMATQYRQQAQRLNDLAQRYEIEAEAKTRELGQDSEEAKRNRTLAKDARAEAQEADELAREYRRQLPHNMVY
jgi:hypothetical protein